MHGVGTSRGLLQTAAMANPGGLAGATEAWIAGAFRHELEGTRTMASNRIIEEERGSHTGRIVHSHNGYYAGDFHTDRQPTAGPARPVQSRLRPQTAS